MAAQPHNRSTSTQVAAQLLALVDQQPLQPSTTFVDLRMNDDAHRTFQRTLREALQRDDRDTIFEAVRTQSVQFATLLARLAIDVDDRDDEPDAGTAPPPSAWQLDCVWLLTVCAQSSVSAYLLARDARVWRVCAALWRAAAADCVAGARCQIYSMLRQLMSMMMPYVPAALWRRCCSDGALGVVALVRSALRLFNDTVEHRTVVACNLVEAMLARRETRARAAAVLIGDDDNGDLFALTEAIFTNCNEAKWLLEPAPPCPECGGVLVDPTDVIDGTAPPVFDGHEFQYTCLTVSFYQPHPSHIYSKQER